MHQLHVTASYVLVTVHMDFFFNLLCCFFEFLFMLSETEIKV